jgi:hypothetical protein
VVIVEVVLDLGKSVGAFSGLNMVCSHMRRVSGVIANLDETGLGDPRPLGVVISSVVVFQPRLSSPCVFLLHVCCLKGCNLWQTSGG